MSPVFLGSTEVTKLLLGTVEIDSIFQGVAEAYSGVPTGQALYGVAGSFSWTCPDDVVSICVVCVGGGGGGMHYSNGDHSMAGGAGGGLGWKNNITVVPGNTYTVNVGSAGQSGAYSASSTAGGPSNFLNTSTVQGTGGAPGRYNQTIPTSPFTGDGGGVGGGVNLFSNNGDGPQGGGGAGGYSGAGGQGGYRDVQRPTGGAGGGGAGGGNNGSNTGYGAGGVGVLGEGTSGAVDPQYDGVGGGGSGGASGSGQIGGSYGAGGGGGTASAAGDGSSGAVRIIWGNGRAFPSTLTADQ
jgi:hypothetical protein